MRIYFLILSFLISVASVAQTPNYIYGRDVIITTRDTSSAELTIKNTTRNVLGYFKNIGGGKGRYTLIPQIDITGLPDSLLARYTKTQSDARYKPIGYFPSWAEITGIPANFTTTYALSNDVRDSILRRLRIIDTSGMLFPYTRVQRFLDSTLTLRTLVNTKQNILTNPVTGTATLNTILKASGSSIIGNSNISDDGTLVTINSNARVNNRMTLGSTIRTNTILSIASNLTGNPVSSFVKAEGDIQSDVTDIAFAYLSQPSTQAASFSIGTLIHYGALQGTIRAGSSILNQIGFSVDSSILGAANSFGFVGGLAGGANRWNLFMQGTANNYLNGRTLFGTTVDNGNQRVQIDGGLIATSGITGSRFNGSSMILRKDSVPIAVKRYALILDTITGLVERYDLNLKQNILTNPITGTGTINTLPKFTGASALGNSNIADNGSTIVLGGSNVNISGNSTTTGRVGIGSSISSISNLYSNRAISGGATAVGIYQDGTVQSDVTTSAFGIFNNLRTQATSFNLTNYFHNYSSQSVLGAGSSVTNQYAYFVENNLTGAAFNYAYFSSIASGQGRWNNFMNGTARNFFRGITHIGDTVTYSGSPNLSVTGKAYVSDTIRGGTIARVGGTSTQSLQADGSVVALTSGIYLPVAANVSNTSAITVDTAQFTRVGNVVTVSGRISFTNTLNSPSQISITLPVATVISSVRNVAGVGNENVAMKSAIIRGRTGTNDALLEVDGLNSSTYTIYYTYKYRIL